MPGETGGRIVLAATPIGNPRDASPRLREALAGADVVAAEDTRRLRRLAADLGVAVTAPVISLFDHNEAARSEELLRRCRTGATVLVVSDAGMPTVSDPGFHVVQAAIAAEVPVTVLPGPSAVLAALAVSGLPTDRFTFEGFVPRKPGKLRAAATQLAREPRTMVLFESPRRLGRTLEVLRDEIGADRPAVVARELTKTHEEIVRGTLADLAAWAAERDVLGEVVLVLGGAPAAATDPDAAADRVRTLAAQGVRLKDAAKQVAAETGLASRDLYRRALEDA